MALALLVVACGGGGGDDDDPAPLVTSSRATTEDTALPPCREADRTVVFGVFGAATTGGGDAATWVRDPTAEPLPRPHAADIVIAYRDAGYQVLYVTLVPSETRIGDRPVVDAITVWLGLTGFPVGEGVRVWAPPGNGGDPSVALIEELARMGAAGTEVDAGYAGDSDTLFPLVAGGVPSDRVFLVGGSGDAGTTDVSSTPLPDGGLAAHAAEVEALGPVCT